MAVLSSRSMRGAAPDGAPYSVAKLVLLRVAAAGGATRADLQRDLAALFAPSLSGTNFRRSAEMAILTFANQQALSDTKGRLQITPQGLKVAEALFPGLKGGKACWPDLRAELLCRAIGSPDASAIAKIADRPEALAAIVLQKHFDLPAAKPLSPTDLRAELAVIALERAFGNKIKTGLAKKGSGLPGKTARLLAGQLFKKPREISSDGKLVVALAADVLGAAEESLDGIRLALLRRLTREPDQNRPTVDLTRPRQTAPRAANDISPLEAPPPAIPRQIVRPDLREFASAVVDAARPIAEGWPGNKKAFISRVWRAIREARSEWDLTEIAFKGMLAEAHRAGEVMLTTADLKDRCDLKELEDSKILYKNTIWHFVRVED